MSSDITQVKHDRQIETTARQEGMEWMREHLLEHVNQHREDYGMTQDRAYNEALDWVLAYLVGETVPLSNIVDDERCDDCGVEFSAFGINCNCHELDIPNADGFTPRQLQAIAEQIEEDN